MEGEGGLDGEVVREGDVEVGVAVYQGDLGGFDDPGFVGGEVAV